MTGSVPFVELQRQYHAYKSELDKAYFDVVGSGMYVMGPEVEEFERKLAAVCGTFHALAVGNGTDAMALVLKSMGIGQGDEVITAPNSFIASAGAIVETGAVPVFCDVADDHNIDVGKIEAAITDRTKAIIPVHLTGRPADMDAIVAIAQRHGLKVVEDAAQAIGATYKGRPVGSLGDAACFSLHPLKNIFVLGDGGFMTTNDSALHEQVKTSRNHGLINRDECQDWGRNSRLDTLQCAFGLVKLRHFDEIRSQFRAIASKYQEGLKDVVEVPFDGNQLEAVYHNFVICTDRRDELQAHLEEQNIETKIHYPILLHLQKSARNLSYDESSFPNAARLNKRQLSLPIFPELRHDEIDRVIEAIRGFFAKED